MQTNLTCRVLSSLSLFFFSFFNSLLLNFCVCDIRVNLQVKSSETIGAQKPIILEFDLLEADQLINSNINSQWGRVDYL